VVSVDKEKRKGDTPIQDNVKEVLNDAQRKTLPGLEYMGWELCFLRKRLFLDPEIVIRNRNDNRLGVLEYDGNIRIEADVKVRDEDVQTQPAQSDKPPVWTK
jgi:hypothetical protein